MTTSNLGYVFEDSDKNELIFDSLVRNSRPSKEELYKSECEWIMRRHSMRNRRPGREIVIKWLEAIRSGKYKQHKTRLNNGGGWYSVQGILCEITKDITGGEWHGQWFKPKGLPLRIRSITHQNVWPPKFVFDKLNMKDSLSKEYPIGNGQKSSQLFMLNECYDFDQLAGIIEEEYKSILN